MNKPQLLQALEVLVDLIDSWNDCSRDDDRGRSNDALCLIVHDDGSGNLGTINPGLDYSINEINTQYHFDNLEELVNYLAEQTDLDKEE